MSQPTKTDKPRSLVGVSVLIGSLGLALAGWLCPSSDFNVVTGAVFGFLLGAAFGVVADRSRG